jgi:uncharacterized protein (DUF305 family)
MTVDHHFGGVRMAELCVDKATRADLKGLCAKIEDTRSEEIATMRSWLKAWYGTDDTPSAPPEIKPMLDKLAGLSGRAFDVELSRGFPQHHREFLPDADKCRKHAKHGEHGEHGELRTLCHTMFETQREEIAPTAPPIGKRKPSEDQALFLKTSTSVEATPMGARKLASRLQPRVAKRSTHVRRGMAAG